MPACDNIKKLEKLRRTQPKLLREKKIVVTAFFIFVSNLAVSALETGQDRKDDPLAIPLNYSALVVQDHLKLKPLQIQQVLHEKHMGPGILLKGKKVRKFY